ncbi:MAG: 3-hydroxyacyl-CoA dehydrogenase, partial [Oceanospirillaceae bacterium]|nr:3-hydroxyacyl-CoA dehydrogenase [Oceanospirillaceae bacterium]
ARTVGLATEKIKMVVDERANALVFYTSASEAVEGCQFVQECAPEKIATKHQLYAQIEDHLLPHAIVASSASGLMVTEMQQGWRDPSRFILGHPFNPPHLIPLVELVANDQTAAGVLESAEAFYKQVGKVTIRVNREVPAHVANRLQAALWKEAIHLVSTGVASVEDVDKAVWAGPGLRWAAMGPHMLFNLGAGEGGMEEFCRRYADSFHRWWHDLGDVQLDAQTIAKLVAGAQHEAGGKNFAKLSSERDRLIVNILSTNKAIREEP